MSLLQNQNTFNAIPVTWFGLGDTILLATKEKAHRRGYMYGDMAIDNEMNRSSYPNGYTTPYTWRLAEKSGGIGSNVGIQSSASVNYGNLAAGKNATTSISCTASISNAELGLIKQLVAAIACTGVISDADISGILAMVATLPTTGNVTATLRAIGHMLATVNAEASLSPEMNATANMEADITPFTELSPQNLANAVWNSLASSYNESGTMGKTVKQIKSLTQAGL